MVGVLFTFAADSLTVHLSAENLSVDLKKLMAHKDKTVRGLTGGIEHLFKKNNVTYVKGKGVLKVGAASAGVGATFIPAPVSR